MREILQYSTTAIAKRMADERLSLLRAVMARRRSFQRAVALSDMTQEERTELADAIEAGLKLIDNPRPIDGSEARP